MVEEYRRRLFYAAGKDKQNKKPFDPSATGNILSDGEYQKTRNEQRGSKQIAAGKSACVDDTREFHLENAEKDLSV